MKKLLSVIMLVCILASMCTVSAWATSPYSVNGIGYATWADALAAADVGGTITLLDNITAYDIIVIDKSITLDGNGKTLTSHAGRAINVACAGTVTISDLTITCSGERGINVINSPVYLTLSSLTVTADNYAVNVANFGSGSVINISGGTYTGLNTLNIQCPNTQLVATNAEIYTEDESDGEDYANVVVGYYGPGSTVTLNGCTLNYDPDGEGYNFKNETPYNNVLTNNGSNVVRAAHMQAMIDYGDSYYAFSSIAGALDYASDGNTVSLLRDVDMGGQIVDVNKNVILDANSKKITNGAFNVTPGSGFNISNLGNPEQYNQLMSGKLPQPGGIYYIPATADNSNMALWSILALALLSTAFVTRKRKAEN